MFQNWLRLTRDAVLLGLETQRVMALRLMKLSRGGRAAEAEAMRMVTEKTDAVRWFPVYLRRQALVDMGDGKSRDTMAHA